jgi:hypothetical protein
MLEKPRSDSSWRGIGADNRPSVLEWRRARIVANSDRTAFFGDYFRIAGDSGSTRAQAAIRLVVAHDRVPDEPDADGLPEWCQLSGDHAGYQEAELTPARIITISEAGRHQPRSDRPSGRSHLC